MMSEASSLIVLVRFASLRFASFFNANFNAVVLVYSTALSFKKFKESAMDGMMPMMPSILRPLAFLTFFDENNFFSHPAREVKVVSDVTSTDCLIHDRVSETPGHFF